MNVRIRRMTIDDMEMVRQWRMLPEVTKYMYTDPVITLEQQKEWFEKVSKTDDLYWIVEQEGVPVGVMSLVDWDKKNSRITQGRYIAIKNKDSFKLSIGIQYNLLMYAFDVLKVNKVCSEVMSENIGIIKMFELCGQVREGVLRQHIKKNGVYHDVVLYNTTYEDWKKMREKAQKYKFEIEMIKEN